jgi:histone H3/H4
LCFRHIPRNVRVSAFTTSTAQQREKMPRAVHTSRPSSPVSKSGVAPKRHRRREDGGAGHHEHQHRHRRRRRTKAKSEVRKYSRDVSLLMKTRSLCRVMKKFVVMHHEEITGRTCVPGKDARIVMSAVDAAQNVAEGILCNLVGAANADVRRRKKKRLRVEDARYMYALLYPELARVSEIEHRTTANSLQGRPPPVPRAPKQPKIVANEQQQQENGAPVADGEAQPVPEESHAQKETAAAAAPVTA